jgi:Tfp pilus assembly protein PilV
VNVKQTRVGRKRLSRAFTLLEVMIAVAVFFSAIFALLGLVSQNLKAAHSLQKPRLDLGALASQLALTNRLEEGPNSGNFGDLYPNATWTRTIRLVSTNGFFEVDFIAIDNSSGRPSAAGLNIYLYRPDSIAGAGIAPR